MKRPIGVTILAIISGLMAVLMALIALQWLGLLPWLGPGPAVRTFNLWYALMYGLLAYIYFWLTQLTFAGSATAQMLISVLAVINIVFGFFHFGNGGWIQILVNLLIVLIVNSASAKLWFSQTQ